MSQIQNDSYGAMMEIMRAIKLDSLVNGVQRKELYGLAWYKAHYSPSAIYLDVGTNQGNSAIVMASALKHQGFEIPSKVYTVDDYSESKTPIADIETARRNIASFGIDDLVSIHVGDDIDFINSLPDGTIDMVFDDSDHSYRRTLDRLRAYVPKLNRNSLIVGHDYYVNLVSVIKAVDDFRAENKDIVSNLRGIPGMFWMFCKMEVADD